MRLTAINIYPVKSCRGLTLPSARLDDRGLHNDRLLMVVDGQGRFVTQRDYPRMCLVCPRIEGDTLTLSASGQEVLTLAVQRTGSPCQVTVWRDTCTAIDQGDAAAAWLSEFLGTAVRLVCMADGFRRQVDPAYAPRSEDQTAFSDGFPLLLISTASLDDLNSRLPQPLPMDRFRPNLVVEGCAPYAEDGWSRIRVGELLFDVVKPCSRCAITTTDQLTAARAKEPLRTLAGYRRLGTDVFFGQNVIHVDRGLLRTGDVVDVLTMREPPAFA